METRICKLTKAGHIGESTLSGPLLWMVSDVRVGSLLNCAFSLRFYGNN